MLSASVGQVTSQGQQLTEAVTPAAGSSLTPFIPILLVLPNAIYGLWLMRNISRTHTNPEI